MEGIALILGKMNALGTSGMNVINAGKVALLYVPFHTLGTFILILLLKKHT